MPPAAPSPPSPPGPPPGAGPSGARRSWTLGIADGPDGGAALVDGDGQLCFAVSEGSLTRRVGQFGFPSEAVALALQERLGRGGRIEAVAVAERAGRALGRLLDQRLPGREAAGGPLDPDNRFWQSWSRGAARLAEGASERASRRILSRRLRDLGLGHLPFALVDRHDALAWAAAAGADDALVLTMDTGGDGVCGAVHRLERGLSPHPRMRRCRRVPSPHGPGLLRAAVARLLQVPPGELSARAATGDPLRLRGAFADALGMVDGVPRLAPDALPRLLARLHAEPPDDVAAALAAHTEHIVIATLTGALRDFGGRRLRLGGSLFADSQLTRAVAEFAAMAGMQDVFAFPAARDEALPVGAALAARVGRGGPVRGLTDARIGPLAWDESAQVPLRVPPLPLSEDPAPARGALSSGEVVARCIRRMEFGATSHGARGLLLAADRPELARQLRERLGRPRAPLHVLVPSELAPALLATWGPVISPLAHFGAVALRPSEALAAQAPGALHDDGTVLAQVLRKESDPTLHAMLLDMPGQVLLLADLALPGEPRAASLRESALVAAAVGAALLWVG